jgi:hypothetical protein
MHELPFKPCKECGGFPVLHIIPDGTFKVKYQHRCNWCEQHGNARVTVAEAQDSWEKKNEK